MRAGKQAGKQASVHSYCQANRQTNKMQTYTLHKHTIDRKKTEFIETNEIQLSAHKIRNGKFLEQQFWYCCILNTFGFEAAFYLMPALQFVSFIIYLLFVYSMHLNTLATLLTSHFFIPLAHILRIPYNLITIIALLDMPLVMLIQLYYLPSVQAEAWVFEIQF